MIAVLVWVATASVSVMACIAGAGAWASMRRQQRTAVFMHRACRSLLAARDLDDATVELIRRACTHFRADIGVLKLFPTGPEGNAFRTSFRAGIATEVMEAVDADDDDELGGLAPDGIARVQAMSLDERVTRVATRLGVGEGIAVALRHDGRAIGQLLLGRRSAKHPFSADDEALLREFGELVGLTLERSRLHDALVRVCALQAELADRAFHDPLTQLANRVLFVDRVDSALRRRESARDVVGVVHVDLDGFRLVNEEHGHLAADAVLVETAKRLQACMRRADTAARLGGDEFAVLLVELIEPREAELIAQRIVNSIAQPFAVQGMSLSLTASVGLATASVGAVSASQLLRRAANTLESLRHGEEEPALAANEPAPPLGAVAAELSAALSRRELLLHFQPIVELESGTILGAEALVRWAHPQRGVLPPADFLPAAEESGMSAAIGGYVMRSACKQIRHWQEMFKTDPPLAIAVNVSASELRAAGFTAGVLDIVRETGVDPGCLIIEVTENAVLDDLPDAIAKFDALQRGGVHVAIDDVGTGYTSLAYLRRLPIDILKIARPLVSELGDPAASGELARTVIRHGHALRLVLVAEGVEGAVQVRRLEELGCTMAQGFHLARPGDAAAMEAMLEGGALDPRAFSAAEQVRATSRARRRPAGGRVRQVRSARAPA